MGERAREQPNHDKFENDTDDDDVAGDKGRRRTLYKIAPLCDTYTQRHTSIPKSDAAAAVETIELLTQI